MPFRDRSAAGCSLASRLRAYANQPDVIVLALPRGGVPVAYEVAEGLGAPLDIFLVRPLGVPGSEGLAIGAVASGGVRVLDDEVIRALGIPGAVIDAVAADEHQEVERRERAYRDDRPAADVRGSTIILVDDGLATGSPMRAAVAAVRQLQPARVIVAAPVAAASAVEHLRGVADEIVFVEKPAAFLTIDRWYEDFSRTRDDEIRLLLERAGQAQPAGAP